ncbi:flagellar M-ring protein FliF, partial [Porticoccaceae bacterium]|nr:flagellar M-ring protein FliF [Porticoccaceae bacterium]
MATTVANPNDLNVSANAEGNAQVPAPIAGSARGQAMPAAPEASASTTSIPSIRQILDQPAVRKSMPAIIAL